MDSVQLESRVVDVSTELLSSKEEQLRLAALDRYDDQLDQIRRLQDQQAEQQQVLDQLMMQCSRLSLTFSTQTQNVLSSIFSKISSHNIRLDSIIRIWYSEDSGIMKQVRNHRTTLHAYGGVNQVDVISYYIDDKK